MTAFGIHGGQGLRRIMSLSQHQSTAEGLLRQAGSRVTRGRVIVLASLLDANRALTHGEVQARIGRPHRVDRVTLYRILDWLTHSGIAHRISGDDGVWRFTAKAPEHSGVHPHFECNTCGNVICLRGTFELPTVVLPAGFRGDEVELTVKGECAYCRPRTPKAGRSRSARRRTASR